MQFDDAFERNPSICGGQPVGRGARVPRRALLSSLAEGATFEEILTDFPTVTEAQWGAVIASTEAP